LQAVPFSSPPNLPAVVLTLSLLFYGLPRRLPQKYTFHSRSTRLTSLLTLYQNKIRKLKHQYNQTVMKYAVCIWREIEHTHIISHSIAYFKAEVYEQRKEH